MVRKVLLGVAGFCLSASVVHGQLMQIPHLENAPFEAVNTVTTTDSNGTHQVAGKVARNSVGSSYQEQWSADTNKLVKIFIIDMPNKRFIQLDPINKLYSIQNGSMLQASTLAPGAAAQQILQAQNAKPTHKEVAGLMIDVRPLGTKEIAGIATLGELTTRLKPGTGPGAMDQTLEKWISPDLQIAFLTKLHDALHETDYLSALSPIDRNEPNPALFMIPVDYQQDPSNVHASPAPQAGTTSPH